MALCKDCVVVARHEGTPVGTIESIGGVDTYVSVPSPGCEYDKTKAVLFLTDAFGHRALHNQLLADDFARAGYQVYVPDLFNGDPVTQEMMATLGFDHVNTVWVPKHSQEVTRPFLNAAIAGIKERGITTFGSTGYCFGGRCSLDLAIANIVTASAAVIAHPGLVDVPDFVTLRSVSKAKILVVSCEDDFSFPMDLQARVDEAMKGWENYERKFWKGCRHGFAARGDPKDDVVRTAKEEAFAATVAWFKQSL